ncbi:thiamine pyrophosphate-dependent enzyme [Marinivivus vitaminiproducens]|uniref:thiamine pyrophosphate-dependent enzyme n=1 Tax=Marinivivus vitaminiproducens TaxID=3035935 RepID=UPI00279CEABC|nr:thiamine pyrophosphate-dependent enzyme [Geminicoccaceae bacterium SCSIO 64248]
MKAQNGLLHRRAVVSALLRDRNDLLVVGGLGAPAWDITAAGDHDLSFPLWGAMGGASMIGLGLALAQPDRPVLVVTGDGEMLMGVGSLMTIGVQSPANLSIVVLDNERYGETGMQRTHTGYGVDLVKVAEGAGFKRTLAVCDEDQVGTLRRAVHERSGPLFANVKVDPEKLPLVLPPSESSILKNRFRKALLGEEALFA